MFRVRNWLVLKTYSENVAHLFKSLAEVPVDLRTQTILVGTTKKMHLNIFMEISKKQMSEEK